MLKTSYLSQTNAYKHDTDRDLVYSFDREREREREEKRVFGDLVFSRGKNYEH